MTKVPRMLAVNINLKQTGFDNFSGKTMLPSLPGGCAFAAIASAPGSIIKC